MNVSKHLLKLFGMANLRIVFVYIIVKVKNSSRIAKSGEDAIVRHANGVDLCT